MDALVQTVLALIQIGFWLMLAGLGLLCVVAVWHSMGLGILAPIAVGILVALAK